MPGEFEGWEMAEALRQKAMQVTAAEAAKDTAAAAAAAETASWLWFGLAGAAFIAGVIYLNHLENERRKSELEKLLGPTSGTLDKSGYEIPSPEQNRGEFIPENEQPVIVGKRRWDSLDGITSEQYTIYYKWKYDEVVQAWPSGRIQRKGADHGTDYWLAGGPYSYTWDLRVAVDELKNRGANFGFDPDETGVYLMK